MNQKKNSEHKNTKNNDNLVKTIPDETVTTSKKTFVPGIHSAYLLTNPEHWVGESLDDVSIIDSFLGEGGMARVYKIWNNELQMHRAIKILLPNSKKNIAARFVTEARIIARLRHPNIVEFYRSGKWKLLPFIEMEFIDGQSLETILLERGAFPAYAVLAIGIFIASALKHAHCLEYTLSGKSYQGVIHRDLKPSNIMLNIKGKLKLMDFGIARPVEEGLHNTLDGEGKVLGTLAYLSPEQFDNQKNVDHRTDIYAVGTILYELTYNIKTFPDSSITDIFKKKIRGEYKRNPDSLVSVPPKLKEIIETCLQLQQEKRYPDAKKLFDALTDAYALYTDEQPDIALKKYLDDPLYTPPETKTTKKMKTIIGNPFNQLQIPNVPQFRFPKISLPPLPRIHLPKIRKPRLPHISIKLMVKKVPLQKIHDVSTAIFYFIVLIPKKIIHVFFKAPLQIIWTIATTILRSISQISKIVYGITGAVILVGTLIVLTYFYMPNKPKPIVTEPPYTTPVRSNTTIDTILPEIISPDFNETIQSQTATIIWNRLPKNSSHYIVHIAATENFLDTIHWKEIAAEENNLTVHLQNGSYYCRLGTLNDTKKHIWSPSRCFDIMYYRTVPELVSPSEEDVCDTNQITFTWKKTHNTQTYDISIAIDDDFNTVLWDSSACPDTALTVQFDTIQPATYFWRVRSGNKNDTTWSQTSTFTFHESLRDSTVSQKKDYVAEASKTLRRGMLGSAEKLISKVKSTDPRKDSLLIRLAEEYVEINNTKKAKSILKPIMLNDIFVCYLKSRILYLQKKYAAGFTLLDTMTCSKTQFTTKKDSSDVTYWRAVITHRAYNFSKSKKIGRKAYYAWNSVKSRYHRSTSSPRYSQALTKMYQLYYTDNVFMFSADSLKQLRKKSK